MIKTISAFLASLLLLSFAFAETNKGDITFKLKKADPVVFSHDYHKSKGIKCAACHFQTFAESGNSFQMKKEKLTKQDFCVHCHNGMKSFDVNGKNNCTKCHKKQG